MNKLLKIISEKDIITFNKEFAFYEKTKDTSLENNIRYRKFLVIKLLMEGHSYNSVKDFTGLAKSTMHKIVNNYLNDKKNFYKDNRITRSNLNNHKDEIRKVLDDNVPSSLMNACRIIENHLNIKCGKTTMKEFLDKNNYNHLIFRDKKSRNKKIKYLEGKEYRRKRIFGK